MTIHASNSISTQSHRAFLSQWTGLAVGDEGAPIAFSQFTDKSVQVSGIFGAGGGVSFVGSNDGVEWAPLTDPQGNALTFIAQKIKLVCEATALVKPVVTGGDGTTNLTVTVLMKE
jgi:hypothetical protein